MWDEKRQVNATLRFLAFVEEFNAAYALWQNALQSGQPAQTQAQVEDVLRRWRAELERLRGESDMLMANESLIDELSAIVTRVTDERATLRRLRGEAGTRLDQADSVNPKVRESPYTNLLGLQRVFKPSVRLGVIIAAIVFAVLALGAMGFLIYGVISGSGATTYVTATPGGSAG